VPDGVSFRTRVVLNRWPAIQANMLMGAEAATSKAAMDMEAGMKRRAPNTTGITPSGFTSESTGFLRNSIQARKVGPAHWRVTVTADYGVYLEYGTRHMRAQPYFFPTIADVTPAFMAAMRRITQ
jgi:HK97 gp10 family phage protein